MLPSPNSRLLRFSQKNTSSKHLKNKKQILIHHHPQLPRGRCFCHFLLLFLRKSAYQLERGALLVLCVPPPPVPLQSQWSLYHHKGFFCAAAAPLLSGRWSDRPPILTGPFSHRPPAFNIPVACLFSPFLLPRTPPHGGGQWSVWSAPPLEGAARTACGAAVSDCWDCLTAPLLY